MATSSTPPPSLGNNGTSTRPYLIRALHEWCTDNGFTPYVAVFVDASVQVPNEHVKNNEIVLNVGFEATTSLKLGNEFIEFKARFGGVARDILVPIDHVIAIYARENGQGMAFPAPTDVPVGTTLSKPHAVETSHERPAGVLRLASDSEHPKPTADLASVPSEPPEPPDTPPPGSRPSLKRIK